MRNAIAVTVIVLSLNTQAVAECDDLPSEGVLSGSERFSRAHEVGHFNGESPSVVQDELAFWKEKSGTTCFYLRTVGPNRHECEVIGALKETKRSQFKFENGRCSLTFQRSGTSINLTTSPGWERLGRGGVCTKDYCGLYGEVESGTFR